MLCLVKLLPQFGYQPCEKKQWQEVMCTAFDRMTQKEVKHPNTYIQPQHRDTGGYQA